MNMEDGIKFDIQPKDIKRLNYKTKFHKFIADQKPYARASFFYP